MSERQTAQTPERLVTVEDSVALSGLLRATGYDVSQWGVGPTKTVESLWTEIANGESELVEVGGALMRRTYALGVDIVAEVDGTRYKLREDRQVFRNGSERRRTLPTSIGEKARPDEDMEAGVRRAIAEELGIHEYVRLTDNGSATLVRYSQTYGGMPTEMHMRYAEVEIVSADFRPEGYVEEQAEKSIYFVWEPVQSAMQ